MDVAWPRVLSYVRDEREKCRKLRTAFACGWSEIGGADFRYMARRSPPVRTLRVLGTPRSAGREETVVGRNFRLKGLQVWGCDEEWVERGIDDETRELSILRLGLRGAPREISFNALGVRVLDLQNLAIGNRMLEMLSTMSELEFVRLQVSSVSEISCSRNFRFASEKIWLLHLTTTPGLSVETPEVQLLSRKFLHGFARPEKLEELHVPFLCQEDMDILRFPRLRTLVVLNWEPEDEAERIAEFFLSCSSSLTSLVLQIRRESALSLDYALWALTKFSASKYPEKLENFEISVQMADNTALVPPELSVDWAVYFRCKWKQNLFFRREGLGVEMRRLMPSAAEAAAAGTLQTPLDLFAAEMFPSGSGGCGVVQEAWMHLHELRRLDYIDIFDNLISTPLGSAVGDTDNRVRKITPRN